jgi:hypothetical protein
MQSLTTAFLALCLAHLTTDFVFQSRRMVEEKRQGQVRAYLRHGAIHLGAALLFLGFASPAWLQNPRSYAAVFGLVVVHLLIDRAKVFGGSLAGMAEGVSVFLLDQVLHLATVFGAALLIVRQPVPELITRMAGAQLEKEKILWILVVYVGVIWGGGYLLRFVTKPLMQSSRSGRIEESDEESNDLQSAGLYIGWLERFVVLTALVLKSPATVGLIVAAKSIARYPEFKSLRFAEYFLIGTLLSISLGILGGLVLLEVLYGSVQLAK